MVSRDEGTGCEHRTADDDDVKPREDDVERRDSMREEDVEKMKAFVQKIADMKMCDDEPERCHAGSGPYCGRHGDLVMDDEIKEARQLLKDIGDA